MMLGSRFRIRVELSCLVIASAIMTTGGIADVLDPQDYMDPLPLARKALVIGVRHYDILDPIPSAQMDVDIIRAKLLALGFTVIYSFDESAHDIWKKVREFEQSISEGDIAFFYFSGHGFQWEGLNYLAGRDAPKTMSRFALQDFNVPIINVIGRLSGKRAGFSLLIIDACRANSLSVRDQSNVPKSVGQSGLAVENVPPQLVVGFATDFGQLAYGDNDPATASIYTRNLEYQIDSEGVGIYETLREVAIQVNLERIDQRPEYRVTVAGNFYPAPDDYARNVAKIAWRKTLETADSATIRSFLVHFPTSDYAQQARRWLDDDAARSEPLRVSSSRAVTPTSIEGISSLPNNSIVRSSNLGFSSSYDGYSDVQVETIGSYSMTSPHSTPVYAFPDFDAQPIDHVAPGEQLKLLDLVPYPDVPHDAAAALWAHVTIAPNTPRERRGYIANAFELQSEETSEFTMYLNAADTASIAANEVSVSAIKRKWWFDKRLPPETDLTGLLTDAAAAAPAGLIAADPSTLIVSVELSQKIEDARSPEEEKQLTFIRSLQIREALGNAGVHPSNIWVSSKDTPGRKDSLKIIVPQSGEL